MTRPLSPRRTSRILVLAGSALAAGLLACVLSAAPAHARDTAASQFADALSEFQRGRWNDAITDLKAFLDAWPGSADAEQATWMLAESYRHMKEWPTAEVEYEHILTTYPAGPHAAEASYDLGLVLWAQSHGPAFDQDMTRRALEQFQRFLAACPDRPEAAQARQDVARAQDRLAEKDYRIARLYLKLHQYDAVRVAVEDLAASYPDSPWTERARLLLAQAYEKQKRLSDALDTYTTLSKSAHDAGIVRVAERKVAELQRRLTQGSAAARAG